MSRPIVTVTAGLASLAMLLVSGPASAGRAGKVKKVYTVKSGDSLSRISKKLKVSQQELRWWNPTLKRPRAMRPGRRLAYFVSPKQTPRRRAVSTRTKGTRVAGRAKLLRQRAKAKVTKVRPAKAKVTKARVTKVRPAKAKVTKAEGARAMGAQARGGSTSRARANKRVVLATRPPASAKTARSITREMRTQLQGVKAREGSDRRAAKRRSRAGANRDRKAAGAPKTPLGRRAVAAPSAARSARVVTRSAGPSSAAAAVTRSPPKRGMRALDWMGRGGRAMPRVNPTPDLLPAGRAKARAEVVGSPNGGRLVNAQAIPRQSPGLRSINRSKKYACDQTIAVLQRVGQRLEQRYPGTQPLLVGALSYAQGGRAGRHRSHQNGLDADIAYFEKGNPKRRHYNGRVTHQELDYEKNWFVIETMLLTGKVNYIFVDRRQLPSFRKAASRAGWSEAALRRLFGDTKFQGAGRIIRHWKGHTYHAHVRFTCPRSDKRCEHSRY